MREIATTEDGRDITRGYIKGILPPQDKLLWRLGANYEIYKDLLTDDQVAACFQQRRLAVVSSEWDVEPASTSRKDKKAADFLKEVLNHVKWDDCTDKKLYGVFYGYSFAEAIYGKDGKQVYLDQLKVRDRRRFKFWEDGSPRLITTHNPLGEELPERKFWYFCTGADNDDTPEGLGLAHYLYWPVFFKRNGMKFWSIFLEKFGNPTTRITYPPNASKEEKQTLKKAAQAISHDTGILLPEGFLIDFLEASRGGTADYSAFHELCNKAITKVILSQTMTTDDGASYSQSKTHFAVRQDVVKSDADLICDSFNKGPATWLTEWNFPGATPPRVWRNLSEDEDLNSRVNRDKTLFDMGWRLTQDKLEEIYGEGYEDTQAQKEKEQGSGDPFGDIFGNQQAAPGQPPETPLPEGEVEATPPESPAPEAQEDTPAASPEPEFTEFNFEDKAVLLSQIQEAIQRYRVGASLVELAELENTLTTELDTTNFVEAVSFATKTRSKSKAKSRKCKKGYPCGSTCISKNRNCKTALPGQAGTYAAWLKTQQGSAQGASGAGATPSKPKRKKKSTAPSQAAPAAPQPAAPPTQQPPPVAAPAAPPSPPPQVVAVQKPDGTTPPSKPKSKVTTNQQELDKKRKDLIDDFGQQAVEDAEKNVQQILESEETEVWVRVGNTKSLKRRLTDGFKNSAHLAEMGIEGENNVPYMKDARYQDARERVEEKVMGVPLDAKPDDRPIYGYYGGNDLEGSTHKDVAKTYGSIAVKLKPETKKRSTITGADSFKSGIASEAINPDGGDAPPPNAASLVSSTRHGYDVDQLDAIGGYPPNYKDKRWRKQHLDNATNAKDIDDLNNLAPSGNKYLEAQIFGGVKPDDIAEIHFQPQEGAKDAPNAEIAQLCKDKGIDMYVNGKKVDPDDYINPPKDKTKRLERALDTYDADEIIASVEELEKDSKNTTLAPGERDAVLKTIYAQRGYDGKPTVTDADTVTKAWQDGGTLMARGMQAGAKSRTQFHDDLKNGDHFVGQGIYGDGTYVSAANGKTKKDAEKGLKTIRDLGYSSQNGVTARMALPKDANVATQKKLEIEQRQTEKALDAWVEKQVEQKIGAATVQKIKDLDDQIDQVRKGASGKPIAQGKTDKELDDLKNNARVNWGSKRKPLPDDFPDNLTPMSTGSKGTEVYTLDIKFSSADRKKYPDLPSKVPLEVVALENDWKSEFAVKMPDGSWQVFEEDLGSNYTESHGEAAKAYLDGYMKQPLLTAAEQKQIRSLSAKRRGQATKLKAAKEPIQARANAVKNTLFGDASNFAYDAVKNAKGNSGRYAAAKGYDAVKLNNSYRKDNFMLLLNRSKTLVQDDEVDWNTGVDTFGG